MEGWKPLATLARSVDVPEASARRYAETFSTYFRSRKVGKAILYDPEAGDVLRAISNAFGEGRRRAEVLDLLTARFDQTHEVTPVRGESSPPRHEPATPMPAADIAPAIQAFPSAVDRLASAMERQNEIQARTLATIESRLAALEASSSQQDRREPEAQAPDWQKGEAPQEKPFWKSLLRFLRGGPHGE